jgi:predicted membrane-bound spermidine synthase
MTANSRRAGIALLWIFTASGFAGLIYESIWTHYLGLILGHSAYAQVLVLALFMGGMALGAWLISRRSELLKRPLVIYALIELVLGIFGIGFHIYFRLISGWAYDSLFAAMSPGLSLELARWFVAGMLILPQCVLLGMTFPLMSAGYIRWRPESSGNILAGLYFSNSLGAALGALTATFVLLPKVGLPGTVLTAGIISVLVAISVWPLARSEQPQAIVGQAKSDGGGERSVPAFILLMAAITGASSFIYEVSWVRMLSMVLGGTIHAFEIMLAAFIAGIAFGGLWLRKRADRLASPRRAAGWAQIAMGCMALSTLFLYSQSFSWLAWVLQVINRSAESAYTLYNIASAIISMLIMLPTAFFAGMTLPLLTLTLLKDGAGEAAIGKTYAANTLGAIIGVVLAVFVGLPLLGLRLSLWLAAAADIVIGILLLLAVGRSSWTNLRRPDWKVSLGMAASALLLVLSLALAHFDPLLMSSTVFRFGNIPKPGSDLKVFSHKDGRTASVTLREVRANAQRTIFTNGKPDASISFDNMPAFDEMTMMVAGIMPMLHHPQARSAAIIGFGSGMTTHFVLGNPGIESVDTIEIEPAMVEAAQSFRPVVERAFSDPRSHIIIDDAKSYFATNRKRYDIIISEPSNPWVNGVASLFTEEFYAFIPRHLNEGGVFAQWVQAYEISPAQINSIIRAMAPHFADVRLFSAGATDWLLVASPSRRFANMAEIDIPHQWNPAVHQELATRGIANKDDLALLFNGDKAVLQAYSGLYPGSGTNSDFFPILQLGAAKSRFNNAQGTELSELRLASWPVFEALTGLQPPPLDHQFQPVLIDRYQLPFPTAVRKAQAIHAVLSGQAAKSSRTGIVLDEKLAIEYLLSAGANCRFDSLGTDGLIVLSRLAGITIPYLRAEDGKALWDQPRWVKCQPTEPLMRDYFAFIGAIAGRDHPRALRIGQAFLNDKDQFASLRGIRAAMDYLVGGMQLSAYATGNFGRVLQLEDEFGEKLSKTFARVFLVQAARAQVAGSDNSRRDPSAR